MRFMVIVKASTESEDGKMPTETELRNMGKFNDELSKAGVMLAAEGLLPSSKGARIQFNGTKRTVVDGPFNATQELVAGFWLVQVKSREEAIELFKRCPFVDGELELRQLAEDADFGDMVNKVPEVFEAERKVRESARH